MITTMMKDLEDPSNDDQGVRTLKRSALASMKRRLGHIEELEIYSVSSLLHPK